MIEWYADEDAKKGHNVSKPRQDLLSMVKRDSTFLAAPPDLYRFRPEISFTHPSIDEYADPYIVFASFGYHEGKGDEAAAGWAEFVSATEADEPGTLSYSAMNDSEKSSFARSKCTAAGFLSMASTGRFLRLLQMDC